MSNFDLLHPSIQHHIVNSLGWPALRPLQEQAIKPVMAGDHGMFLAPTAGGKTEAAAFPIFSKMQADNWQPMSVLYLAPLRALLNNLYPRLEQYGDYVGRSVGLWHGDTPQGERDRMLAEPPDLLLTTPESLEAMLISRRIDERWFFRNVRTVVLDEVHSFAASDRGWHLLAVLERLSRIAGRDIQRIGLSATVGNPEELLEWLCGSSQATRSIVNPPAEALAEPEVELDFVGSLDNAATIISRLHVGEKRLVFVDSRARAEQLTLALTELGTTAFVSHGSLGREERHRSEQAFAEGSNCVIVATSTLELGIDVGDLDRVIQIDSPPTVAGFLQRIGRTGRRPGSSRNCLFLTTKKDSLLTAAGLLRLWGKGYVEPASPPPLPIHLLAQQILALTIQEASTGLSTAGWQQWLGEPSVFPEDVMVHAPSLLEHLLKNDWLAQDGGLLGTGRVAEETIGRRNFLELMSAFVSEPLISVRYGRQEIGQVPDVAILGALDSGNDSPALLLAGRTWAIGDIDWKRRIARVTPENDKGKIRFGGTPLPQSFELCQSIAAVVEGETPDQVHLTKRAEDALEDLRSELSGVRPGRTVLLATETKTRWYTFAGMRANIELAARLSTLGERPVQKDNWYITLDQHVDRDALKQAINGQTPEGQLENLVERVSGALKLQDVLPQAVVTKILVERLSDPEAVEAVTAAPVDRAVGS